MEILFVNLQIDLVWGLKGDYSEVKCLSACSDELFIFTATYVLGL